MDASSYVVGALGVVVILAGFWAFIGTQFVRKDVLEVEHKRFDEKLDAISGQLTALTETSIVKSTIHELADRLANSMSNERLPIRNREA